MCYRDRVCVHPRCETRDPKSKSPLSKGDRVKLSKKIVALTKTSAGPRNHSKDQELVRNYPNLLFISIKRSVVI